MMLALPAVSHAVLIDVTALRVVATGVAHAAVVLKGAISLTVGIGCVGSKEHGQKKQ